MLPTLYKENVVGHRLIIESKYYVVADGFQSPKFCVQYYLFIPEAQLSTFVTFIIIRLADVMFGDESDDDAKDMKKEYTFKPKYRGGRSRKRTVDKDDEEEEDESESENSNE
jgi:hypothetical protein